MAPCPYDRDLPPQTEPSLTFIAETYTFDFPTCIPDGEYLLRIEQLGIHNPWPAGIPQFYISCAQISVSGGSGSFSPSLSIPGHVSESDSGYTANVSLLERSKTVLSKSNLCCRSTTPPSPLTRFPVAPS